QDPIALDYSGEQAIPIIESLSGLTHGEFVVNIPNQGQIHGLPHGVVVEGIASIDRDGVHPRVAPDLPTGVMAWMQTHVAAQELVVAAALERRFDLALQAVRLDPLCHRLNGTEARNMLAALDAHNALFGPALLQ